jgi:hypothetical protein
MPRMVSIEWVVAVLVGAVVLVIFTAALASGKLESNGLVKHGIRSVTVCGVERPHHVFDKLSLEGAWLGRPGPEGCVTFDQLSPSTLD